MSSPLEQVMEHARRELTKAIVGQADALDLLIVTVICGGHALVEGVPGLAKTLAVRTLARLLRLQFQRVQGTPDLMPADITGSSVFNMGTGTFALCLHLAFDSALVNGDACARRDLDRQVERVAEGVIQHERLGAAQDIVIAGGCERRFELRLSAVERFAELRLFGAQ